MASYHPSGVHELLDYTVLRSLSMVFVMTKNTQILTSFIPVHIPAAPEASQLLLLASTRC